MISISEMEAHLALLGFVFNNNGILVCGIDAKDSDYSVERRSAWQIRPEANPPSYKWGKVHPAAYSVYKADPSWLAGGVMILRTESYEIALRKLYELVTEEK